MNDKLPKPMNLHIPISKIDEEQRTVWGYATVEELDKHGEIVSYEASKRAFKEWPGNIREMHQDIAVGKAIEVKFDDANKGVWIGARISESDDGQNAWIKVKEGVLQGFSIGGSVNDWTTTKMKVNGKDKDVLTVIDYDLGETSLVDNPAVASAMFQIVKSEKGGALVHREKMLKAGEFKAPWWMRKFKYADSQRVMKPSVVLYNKDSMAKKPDLAKNIWSAGMLVDLGRQLADYVWMQDYEGQPVDNLKDALEQIKQAASKELTEPENWPEEMGTAIELAMKTLNLSKKDLEDKMSSVSKTTQGQPERDAEGKERATAEQTGRPLNDTKERATENDLPEVGATTTEEVETPKVDADGNPVTDKKGNPKTETEEKEVVQGPEYVPEAPQGDADTNWANEDAKDKAEAGAIAAQPPKEDTDVDVKGGGPAEATTAGAAAATADDDKGGKAPKKSAGADDLTKSTDDPLVKSILSGVEGMIKPLSDRIAKLEGQPAPGKGKPSFAVEKGADVEEEQNEHKAEFDRLLKRSEELARSPTEGTPDERIQIAVKLRKLSRLMDPASVAKHAAIRATFAGPQGPQSLVK